MIFFQILICLIGFICLVLMIRAIIKGANYITASNANYSERTLRNVFHKKRLSYVIFRATPIAIVVISTLAGYLIIHALLYPMGEFGFINRDSEWVTYRYIFSSTIGAPLGLFYTQWFFKLCRSVPFPKELDDETISNEEELQILLGLPK